MGTCQDWIQLRSIPLVAAARTRFRTLQNLRNLPRRGWWLRRAAAKCVDLAPDRNLCQEEAEGPGSLDEPVAWRPVKQHSSGTRGDQWFGAPECVLGSHCVMWVMATWSIRCRPSRTGVREWMALLVSIQIGLCASLGHLAGPGDVGEAQLQPLPGDFLGRPLRGDIGPIADDEVQFTLSRSRACGSIETGMT
jgi:hypothetical protein